VNNAIEPQELPLDELRSLRAQLQSEDDALSYVRRLVQARLDLVLSERQHRVSGQERTDVAEDLRAVLGEHLVASGGGLARPPRPTEDASGHPLAIALDELYSRLGGNHMSELSDGELDSLSAALDAFEHERSHERRDLFDRLDALSAELVRRYRDGEASVEGLLAEQDTTQ
jgi:hypothetical protein